LTLAKIAAGSKNSKSIVKVLAAPATTEVFVSHEEVKLAADLMPKAMRAIAAWTSAMLLLAWVTTMNTERRTGTDEAVGTRVLGATVGGTVLGAAVVGAAVGAAVGAPVAGGKVAAGGGLRNS